MGQALAALAAACDECLGFPRPSRHHTLQDEVDALQEGLRELRQLRLGCC